MEKRRQGILDFINQLGEVNMAQLHELFPTVSEVTLRKDLRALDEDRKIVRTHGGAKSINIILENNVNFFTQASLHTEEKYLIAQKAVKLLHPGCSVYIAPGTSCVEFARQMPNMPSYVFTSGIVVAYEIPACENRYVEIFGGQVNSNLMRIIGPSVIKSIENLHFDYAVLGAAGFHPDYGIPQPSASTWAITDAVVAHSDKVIVLIDSSKINDVRSPWNIPVDKVDIIVSDGHLPENIQAFLQSQGITVL